MMIHTNGQRQARPTRASGNRNPGLSFPAAHMDAHGSPADGARAADNVAEWRKFLPPDCVEAMIKDGWHRSV
jgi:hypothetical protein